MGSVEMGEDRRERKPKVTFHYKEICSELDHRGNRALDNLYPKIWGQ